MNIIIFDARDEDLSTDLDGMSIINESGNLLEVIEKGKCSIKGLENFNGRIAIPKQDGIIIIFKTNKFNILMSLKLGKALDIATSAPENLIFCDSSTSRKMINRRICSDEAKVGYVTELLTMHCKYRSQ